MRARYRVTVTSAERNELEQRSTTGGKAARKVLYARTSPLVDAGEWGPKWPTEKVAVALGLSPRSIEHLKKGFVEEGLYPAMERKVRTRSPWEIQFGGEFEARLVALACSAPPVGFQRWTIQRLTQRLIELERVPTVSTMTVCETLKKRI